MTSSLLFQLVQLWLQHHMHFLWTFNLWSRKTKQEIWMMSLARLLSHLLLVQCWPLTALCLMPWLRVGVETALVSPKLNESKESWFLLQMKKSVFIFRQHVEINITNFSRVGESHLTSGKPAYETWKSFKSWVCPKKTAKVSKINDAGVIRSPLGMSFERS